MAFPEALRIAPVDYDDLDIQLHRDLYRITPAGAFPRHGVAIERLRQLLAALEARGVPADGPRPD